MKVTVKYFASLREVQGMHEEILDLEKEMTIADLWRRLSRSSHNEQVLMTINMEYVKPEAMIKEGDEIAFFPPVTGG